MSTLNAQGIVDPRTGQLLLTVTDVTVQVEPITLTLRRTLVSRARPQGLLGSRWRSNWESRVVSTPTAVVIDEAPYPVSFTRAGGTLGYQSVTGERLVLQGDGRFVRTTMMATTETFDSQGRLAERDYRNGNKALVRYGPDGRVARIDGPRGSFIQFSADNQRRVTRVEMSTGATVRYGYSGDDLSEVQVNGGPLLRYAYDARGALNRIDDPQSGAVELVYDANLRVVSRRWADGAQERYEYDEAVREQRRIDPTGAITVTRWSPDQRRAELIEPRGGKIAIAFDAAGRLESITGPTGDTTKIVYDLLGRAAALQDPQGYVTHFEYLDATSLLKTITYPDGTRETVEYDAQINPTMSKIGAQTISALTYYADGALRSIQSAGIPDQRLAYDTQGRLQAVMNALGQQVQFTYDRRGNPVRAVNPLGGVTQWEWDAQNRLVSQTDPVGGITRYEYDASGRISRIVQPAAAMRRFEYDARGRVVAETDSIGHLTRYAYDPAGRLIKRTDPVGAENFRYDAAGNLVEWIDSLGRSVQLEHDALGRVTRERVSTGLQIERRYEALGQRTVVEDSSGRKREWQRDGRGQIIAMRDALGAITQFQYDGRGNITTLRDPRGHIKQFAYKSD